MNRLALFFGLMLVLMSFICGAMLASKSGLEAEPVILARATKEAALGQQEMAKADGERARAAVAWAAAREAETRAAALAEAKEEIASSIRLFALGGSGLLLLLAAGLVLCAFRWGWRRAGVSVFYPQRGVNPVLMVEHGGQLVLSDTGRSLGGVLTVDADGKTQQPLAAAAEVQAQLSAQALAASVIAAAAGDQAKTEAAGAVGEALQNALASLPAIGPAGKSGAQVVFSQPKDDGGTMRVVKRNTPATLNRPADKSIIKRGYMADFLKAGSRRGFGRRDLEGLRLSDGSTLSQSLWASLRQAAADAGCLVESGGKWRLRSSLEEALEQLGLSDFSDREP